MVNKNSISVGTAKLNDIAYSFKMKYKLCSLFRLMDNGWKLSKDARSILMIKKGNKLVFEILVRTKTG